MKWKPFIILCVVGDLFATTFHGKGPLFYAAAGSAIAAIAGMMANA